MKQFIIPALTLTLLLVGCGCASHPASKINIGDYKTQIMNQISAPLSLPPSDVEIINIQAEGTDTWFVKYNLLNCPWLSDRGYPGTNLGVTVAYDETHQTIYVTYVRFNSSHP